MLVAGPFALFPILAIDRFRVEDIDLKKGVFRDCFINALRERRTKRRLKYNNPPLPLYIDVVVLRFA